MVRRRRNGCLLRFAAVEVPVAAAGGAFDGAGVVGGGRRRRHELAAAVQSVATQARHVVLQAFLVNHRGAVVYMVALQDAVGERHRLWIQVRVLVDPGRRLYVGFWRFRGCVFGCCCCCCWYWCYYLHPCKKLTTIILIIKPKQLLFVTTSSKVLLKLERNGFVSEG